MKPAVWKWVWAWGGALIVCAAFAFVLSNVMRNGPRELNGTARNADPEKLSRGIRRNQATEQALFRPQVLSADEQPPPSSELEQNDNGSTRPVSVSGHVLDADRMPVEGVLVTLAASAAGKHAAHQRSTTTTDSKGAYEFPGLTSGSVEIAVSLHPESEWVAPPAAMTDVEENRDTSGVDFRLVRGLSVVGFVQSDGSKPVEDAHVSAEAINGPVGGQGSTRKVTYSDAEGFFEIQSLDPSAKQVRIQVTAKGFAPAAIEPESPFDKVHEITLNRSGEVLLSAVDALSSAPLQRFRYRFESGDETVREHPFMKWNEPSLLENPGEAHVQNVPPGIWRIRVEELTTVGNLTGRIAVTTCTVTGINDVSLIYVGETSQTP